MKNMFKYILSLGVLLLVFSSCEKDDFTGHSKLTPTNPTMTIKGVDANGYNLVEQNKTYTFEVELSEAQVVDVNINVVFAGGDATPGADFTFVEHVIIPAYQTTGELTVSVLADDLVEDTETFTLSLGDAKTANATLTPVTATFTLMNYTEGDLAIDFSWATNALNAIGIDLGPTEAVDLRLLLTDPDGEIMDVADGASFESMVLSSEMDDGVYLLGTDIYSSVDAGDFDAPITIDLALAFNQAGVINDMHLDFPAAMTNAFQCDAYRTNMAKITKSGADYTIESDVSYITPQSIPWFGSDGHAFTGDDRIDFASQITTVQGCDFLIFGVNHGWMYDFWGEEVIDEGNVVWTLDEATGEITIENQYVFTTLYDGAEYPYNISGTGTYDLSGEFPVVTLTYLLDQEGFDPSGWCFDNGYMETPYFTATVSLDPTFTGLRSDGQVLKQLDLKDKPVRN